MEQQLKTYRLLVGDENGDNGVMAVSFVDRPATQEEWLMFKDANVQKFSTDEEKREVLGVIMLADTPIYRNNPPYGEHFIIFMKEDIRALVRKFFKDKVVDKVTLDHLENTDGVWMVESFITDKSQGIGSPFNVPDGTWIGRFYVDNDEVWEGVKRGDFKGFSIEALLAYGPEVDDPLVTEMQEIYRMLNKLLK